MSLSNKQLERYSRNILLKGVGIKGQEKLLSSKVLVIGAGGLGSPAAMYLAAAGVGTIVGMHFSEKHYKEMGKYNINAIVAGHISSDNLGINLMLDGLEKKYGQLEFIECSGFRRFRR